MQSVNQVRQLYVVKAVKDVAPTDKGDVFVKKGLNDKIIVQQVGEGGLVASDAFSADTLIDCKVTEANAMATKLKQAVIQLDLAVNSGNPVAGQDYILDVIVSNYIAMADESVLVKFAAVRALSGMTASQFYVELAKSLARNFSRDINTFFKIYLTAETANPGTSSATFEEVTTISKHTGTAYTGVVISEVAQTEDYIVGECPVKPVNFKVVPHTIYVEGDEVLGIKAEADGTVALMDKIATAVDPVVQVEDGYALADLEYFCMGERGDQYRQMGYPRTIRTKYMIDPEGVYDTLDIAFYFQGRGVDVQKSEKLVTFVGEHDVIEALKDKVDAALA